MKSKSLAYLSATALGAAITIATPAMAFHGGGFGGGGMHFGGVPGGGMHFGGMPSRGIVTGQSAFVPGAGRFAGRG